MKYLNDIGFPDAVIAIISVISSFSSALVHAFTWQSWHMYLSLILGVFGGVSRPMIRAILSKAVPIQDTGNLLILIYNNYKNEDLS